MECIVILLQVSQNDIVNSFLKKSLDPGYDLRIVLFRKVIHVPAAKNSVDTRSLYCHDRHAPAGTYECIEYRVASQNRLLVFYDSVLLWRSSRKHRCKANRGYRGKFRMEFLHIRSVPQDRFPRLLVCRPQVFAQGVWTENQHTLDRSACELASRDFHNGKRF